MTKLIITGCPRSGTLYLAQALNAAGIFTGHEQVCTAQGINYEKLDKYAVDVSWCAAGYFDEIAKLENINLIHLMRNPYAVARSIFKANIMQTTCMHMECIQRIIPDIKACMHKEMDFVLEWTKHVMEHTPITYCVETIDMPVIRVLAKAAGYFITNTQHSEYEYRVKTALAKQKVNSIPDINFDEFIFNDYARLDEFEALANYFGYESKGERYANT